MTDQYPSATKHLPIDEPHMIIQPHRDGWMAIVYASGTFQAWPENSTEGPQDPDATNRLQSMAALQDAIDRCDAAARKAAAVDWDLLVHMPVTQRKPGDSSDYHKVLPVRFKGIHRGTGKPKYKVARHLDAHERHALIDGTPPDVLAAYLLAMRAESEARRTMYKITSRWGVPLPVGYGRTSVERANEMMDEYVARVAKKAAPDQ